MPMTERTPGHPDTRTGGHPPADTPGYPPTHRPAPVSAGHPDTRRRTGEPRSAAVVSWLVLFASFGLSAATWIALAELAGFSGHLSVPTVSGLVITLQLAWLMPIAIDGYVVVALILWTAPVPAHIAEFAKKNTYAAAGAGVVAQSAYHALTAWSTTNVLWRALLAVAVGAFPPAVAALTVHMRALIRRKSGHREPGQVPAPGIRPDTVRVATPDSPAQAPADSPADAPVVEADSPADTGPGMSADTRADSGPDTADRSPVSARTPRPDRRADTSTDTATVTPIAGRTRRRGQVSEVSVDELADTLGKAFPGRVGQPTALAELKRVYGTCSRDRAIEAKNLHNARVTGGVDEQPAEAPATSDDEERQPALTTATA